MLNRSSEITIAIALFLVAFLMVFLSRYSRLESTFAIQPDEFQEVLLLHDGGTLHELIPILHQNNIQFDEAELLWAADIKGWRGFRAGRYEVSKPFSYDEFLSKLGRGLQDPFRVMVPGGQDTERLIQRISNQFRFEADALERVMNDSSFLASIEVEQHHLIGRLLPNTYEMYWTASPEQFLRRLMQEFDNAVKLPYEARATELGLTIDEVTTLASIIEWEVRHVEEKSRVSGLYWNRLNRRMRLQADPTVAYAIGERRRLLFADYRVNHPYNTYLFAGLPPGPINNPRITSIKAALYPERHNFIFMVATPDGYHTFTTNYNDHLRESRRWTAWLREQRQIRQQRELEMLEAETENQAEIR